MTRTSTGNVDSVRTSGDWNQIFTITTIEIDVLNIMAANFFIHSDCYLQKLATIFRPGWEVHIQKLHFWRCFQSFSRIYRCRCGREAKRKQSNNLFVRKLAVAWPGFNFRPASVDCNKNLSSTRASTGSSSSVTAPIRRASEFSN